MKKILIVDDRHEVRELVEVTLRGKNYQILGIFQSLLRIEGLLLEPVPGRV